MSRRRRRFFRDDLLAPWITLTVLVGVWALGASLVGPKPVLNGAAARGTPNAPAESTAAVIPKTPVPPRADPVPPRADAAAAGAEQPVDTAPEAPVMTPEVPVMTAGGDVGELLRKRLAIPVAGVEPSKLVASFHDTRGGGRKHEAMDILAPRGTPVLAVDAGRIAKLFTSAAGGLTIYQFDPDEHFTYYYAHLDGYAPGLKDGDDVSRGQTIGYVGVTGNAPPGTPHLHFAIFKLGSDKRWWEGLPLDPFDVLR